MLTRVDGCVNTERFWEDVRDGEDVTRITIDVPYQKVIHNAAATWDFFPGHHDPAYARAQGQDTIFISTLFFQAFVDRVVTDWAGPRAFITRRKIMMSGSVFAGDRMYGQGRVTRRHRDDAGRHLVDIDVEVGNQHGPQCPASVTALLPRKTGE